MVPWAHPSPHLKWHLDRFSRFLQGCQTWILDGSVIFTRLHQCAPHVTRASLGPPESTTQTASRSVQSLLHGLQQSVVRHTRACPSAKNRLLAWGSLDPRKCMVAWAHLTVNPKWHLDRFIHFAQLMAVTLGHSFPQNCPFPCGIWTSV